MHNRELKFIRKGFIIEIDLHYKNYIVEAVVNKIGGRESNTYDVMLRLFRKDVGDISQMDEEHYSLTSDSINFAVYDLVMYKFANGFFKKFIDNYEYQQKCFDRGHELFEEESFGNVKKI